VAFAIDMIKGWGLEFGTLAFRRHYPHGRKGSRAWMNVKHHILKEDLQEVLVIAFKPPYSGRGLARFVTKGSRWHTNFPTRWEYEQYWKMSVLWGYPRLEVWGRPFAGQYDPKKWTRVGPLLDGMTITQSLWIEHAKRFSQPLVMP